MTRLLIGLIAACALALGPAASAHAAVPADFVGISSEDVFVGSSTYRDSALAARRESLGLRGVVYFNWRDLPIAPGGEDYFGLHSGLVDRQNRAKPALGAFERAAAAAR